MDLLGDRRAKQKAQVLTVLGALAYETDNLIESESSSDEVIHSVHELAWSLVHVSRELETEDA